MIQRRRTLLVRMLIASVGSLALAAIAGRGWLWWVAALVVAATAGYVATLRQLERRRDLAARVVPLHPDDVRDADDLLGGERDGRQPDEPAVVRHAVPVHPVTQHAAPQHVVPQHAVPQHVVPQHRPRQHQPLERWPSSHPGPARPTAERSRSVATAPAGADDDRLFGWDFDRDGDVRVLVADGS